MLTNLKLELCQPEAGQPLVEIMNEITNTLTNLDIITERVESVKSVYLKA